MNTTREWTSANPIQGNLLRLSEHREVAIYLREGAAWVADFDSGRAELHSASAWYTIGGGRILVHAQRRDAVETISPLSDEVVRRIESLHHRMEEPTVGPAVQLALAAILAVFRHLKFSTHFNRKDTTMQAVQQQIDTKRYAKCIEVSKRIRWDIDRDVIRGRKFDFSKKFLPDGISQVDRLDFLNADERRLLSQVQGRTYANIFGLVERYIGAKILEISRDHWLGDQTALEALVRFTDEELKHQELFRRIESMVAEGMPLGYKFLPQPNDVASFVLGKSTWAVLALTCHIELFTQVHYRQSIEVDENLSELYKDVFFFHWKEESQHAILDELEWQRENGKLSAAERDKAVSDLIELVAGVDGILQAQAPADVDYFVAACARSFTPAEMERLRAGVLKAYRWQYIVSGVQNPRFNEILGGMITPAHGKRIGEALAPIMQ